MLGGDSNEFAVIVIITGVALVPTIFLLDCSSPSDSVQGYPSRLQDSEDVHSNASSVRPTKSK